MDIYGILKCPVCGHDMEKDGGTLVCTGGERRHCFDFASSGYVNLLPPGKGKNAHTGDDKMMISARSAFLGKGYYSKISERIGNMISEFARDAELDRVCFADCGCGEGYHTLNILKTVAGNGIGCAAYGFDASKHGTDRAAKTYRAGTASDQFLTGDSYSAFFAASNIFSLPIKDGSADFAVSMFAPIAGEEMKRILKRNGRLIVAASGEKHLFELRSALYDEPRCSSGSVRCPDGFTKVAEETLSYVIDLKCNADIMNLFSMTPFYYRTSPEDVKKLEKLDRLSTSVEVKLCSFEIL